VQTLGLTHDSLTQIHQVLATSGRVSSAVAAAAVTERRLATERGTQATDGYSAPNDPSRDYAREGNYAPVRGSLGEGL